MSKSDETCYKGVRDKDTQSTDYNALLYTVKGEHGVHGARVSRKHMEYGELDTQNGMHNVRVKQDNTTDIIDGVMSTE